MALAMRHSRLAALAFTAALLAATADARAQTATVRPQRFFFRAALGVGYGAFWTTIVSADPRRSGDLRLSGFGAMGNFALGMSVLPGRFALHVDACALSLVTPEVTNQGTVVNTVGGADSTSTVSIIGGGFTLHLPWGGVWTNVTGGVSILAVEIPASRTGAGSTATQAPTYGRTQLGWGFNVLAGRDFSIGRNWSVGVAAHVIFASVPDLPDPRTGYAPQWYGLGGGVSVTLTDH